MKSVLSIRYWLWWHTKHISALSHFFWFVYNLLCLIPFAGHKWVGSGASGNRVLLYWWNRCSPAGSLWHMHIFCEVAGTMGDSGSHSCYVFQLLLPFFSCSVCRITVSSNCWAQEQMKYSLGDVLQLGVSWLLQSWLLSIFYALHQGNWFLIVKTSQNPESTPYKSQELRFSVPACFSLLGFYRSGWKFQFQFSYEWQGVVIKALTK